MATTFTRTSSGAVKVVKDGKSKSYSGYATKIFPSDDGVNVHVKVGEEELIYAVADITTINGVAAPATAELIADSLRDDVFFLDNKEARQVLVSNTQLSHTGGITETTVFTGTIPGNSIGPNGSFIINWVHSHTNNANSKTFRIKFNGAQVLQQATSAVAVFKGQISIHNRNSLIAQAFAQNPGQGSGDATALGIGAFDTSADITVTVTVQLAVGTDTAALEVFQIIAIG